MKKTYFIGLVLVPSIFLSACSINQLPSKIKELDRSRVNQVDQLSKEVGNPDREAVRNSLVSVKEGAWLLGNPVKIEPVVRLPKMFYETITFNREIVSLNEFGSRLTELTGLPSNVDQLASRSAISAIHTGSAPLPGITAERAAATSASVSGASGSKTLRVVYRGTLKNLLDTVTSRLGIYWEYQGGAIQFYMTRVRTYTIHAVAGDTDLNASVASQGGGGGSGTASKTAQSIVTTAKLSLWQDIEKTVKSMLTSSGTVHTSMATGSITVKDSPDILLNVEQYLDELNKELSKQIALEVNVYTVAFSSSDQYGLDWNAVFNKQSKLSLSVTPIGGGVATAGSMLLGVVSDNVTSKTLFQALSSVGKTRRSTTASVIASNNQAVPVQVGTQTAFISGSTTTLSGANAIPVTTQTVSNITTGFNMTLLPRMIGAKDILLQFSIDMSLLKQIRSFATTTSRIEMPEIDTRNFMQRVSLRSGETLIVSGFEQMNDVRAESGVFKSDNPFFGNKTNQGARDVLVITIRPTHIPARY